MVVRIFPAVPQQDRQLGAPERAFYIVQVLDRGETTPETGLSLRRNPLKDLRVLVTEAADNRVEVELDAEPRLDEGANSGHAADGVPSTEAQRLKPRSTVSPRVAVLG